MLFGLTACLYFLSSLLTRSLPWALLYVCENTELVMSHWGFLLNYSSVWLCLSCSIPSRDFIQPIFTSLLPSGRDDDSHSDQWRTPVRPNNKDTWMHTKILNMWIHNVIIRHVWTTPQQLCAGFLSIMSSLTYVHFCVTILWQLTIT